MDKDERQAAVELVEIFRALDLTCVGLHVPSLTLDMLKQMRKVVAHGLTRAQWLASKEIT